MIQNDTDKKMVQLVEAATDLSCGDICTLLEVAHSLPFVGNLEGGDTYINVLTREKESMVIAQYRHPNYDLYKRSIIGEIERREDEPAVYRALEEGISGRGLIGIIDEGRTVVRHTVSPILNSEKKVIGALTYEYPNAGADTESIRITPRCSVRSDQLQSVMCSSLHLRPIKGSSNPLSRYRTSALGLTNVHIPFAS